MCAVEIRAPPHTAHTILGLLAASQGDGVAVDAIWDG